MFAKIIAVVLPMYCVWCHQEIRPDHPYLRWVCHRCFSLIPIKTNQVCLVCMRTSEHGETHALCKKNIKIDQLLVASFYDHPLLAELVHVWKYNFVADVAKPLAQLAREQLEHVDRDVTAIPLPLHKLRERWRGFNQAELLARELGLTYDDSILRRIKKTKIQKELDKTMRARNVHGAFALAKPLEYRKILLIDDVATTCATLNECAKILKAAGAEHVSALVLARG